MASEGMKVQFGSGANQLHGWKNHDSEVPIQNRLPYGDESVEFVLASHVVEHVTVSEAWGFFHELHRILKHGGVARIAVPDVARIWKLANDTYGAAVKAGGHGDGSRKSCVQAALREHGHKAAWTAELLETLLQAVGFSTVRCEMNTSYHKELIGVDGHHAAVGWEVANIETSTVEATK